MVDGLDAAAVGEAVARAEPDAIIHEMTALSGTPDFRHFDRWFALTNRLRTEGTEHLLAAAKASGVERFVAQSFTGWSNSRRAAGSRPRTIRWIRTRSRRRPRRSRRSGSSSGPSSRRRSRGSSSATAGCTGRAHRRRSATILRKRMFPVIGNGAGMVSSTHVDDAAGGTVAALERGRRGIYNIVDDEPAPSREFIPAIAEAVGAPKPLRIPAWLGRLLAGEVAVTMMTEGRGSSNAKAKRELGWQPIWPSWRDGFRTASTRRCRCRRVRPKRREAQARRRDPDGRGGTSPRPMSIFGRCCSRSPTGCWAASARPRTSSRRRSSATSGRSPADRRRVAEGVPVGRRHPAGDRPAQSARVRRETYVGEWLPEPLVTDDGAGDPAELAEQADSLSMSFLVLLERLTPVERAVFLLHDVFDYDFEEVGRIVHRTPATCRQHAVRARRFIAENRPRFEASRRSATSSAAGSSPRPRRRSRRADRGAGRGRRSSTATAAARSRSGRGRSSAPTRSPGCSRAWAGRWRRWARRSSATRSTASPA